MKTQMKVLKNEEEQASIELIRREKLINALPSLTCRWLRLRPNKVL